MIGNACLGRTDRTIDASLVLRLSRGLKIDEIVGTRVIRRRRKRRLWLRGSSMTRKEV